MTGLYEQVLDGLADGQRLPTARPPRASASVILWRQAADGPELFWVRRSPTMRFMGGWHAFPGGGLSKADREVPVDEQPAGAELGPPDGAMPPGVVGDVALEELLPPGLVACALRELFEETGVLLAGPLPPARELEAVRAALEGGEETLGAFLERSGARLEAQRLVYAGRWLTPPLGPVRFDNRFFLLRWTDDLPEPAIVTGELDLGEWIAPQEALELWAAGEAIAAPPIVHILRVFASDGPEAGLERLRAPIESNLGGHRRVEFRPGVILFPQPTPTLPPATHTNAYLLGRGETVLVDPGSPFDDEIERLADALMATERRLGYTVRAIWLTHHHPDHIGGVAALQQRLGLPVRAHPLTMERLEGSDIRFAEPLVEGTTARLAGLAGDGSDAMTLEVLHTPGHARGHLCFWEPDRRWLVGGDMVAGFGTIVIDPPEGDMDDYLGSLERLEALGADTLFPGHGATLLAPSATFAEYRKHRLWREQRVLAAWNDGLRSPGEMLDRVYDDIAPLARPLARRQLVAHLERLERIGCLD